MLARREHSRAELERKLRARGGAGVDTGSILDDLEQRGLLSEARFAAHYARERVGRGFGPLRIGEELRQRGVGAHTAAAALEEHAEAWVDRARHARQRKFGAAAPRDRAEWLRQAHFLEYRGFTAEHVVSALGSDENAR